MEILDLTLDDSDDSDKGGPGLKATAASRAWCDAQGPAGRPAGGGPADAPLAHGQGFATYDGAAPAARCTSSLRVITAGLPAPFAHHLPSSGWADLGDETQQLLVRVSPSTAQVSRDWGPLVSREGSGQLLAVPSQGMPADSRGLVVPSLVTSRGKSLVPLILRHVRESFAEPHGAPSESSPGSHPLVFSPMTATTEGSLGREEGAGSCSQARSIGGRSLEHACTMPLTDVGMLSGRQSQATGSGPTPSSIPGTAVQTLGAMGSVAGAVHTAAGQQQVRALPMAQLANGFPPRVDPAARGPSGGAQELARAPSHAVEGPGNPNLLARPPANGHSVGEAMRSIHPKALEDSAAAHAKQIGANNVIVNISIETLESMRHTLVWLINLFLLKAGHQGIVVRDIRAFARGNVPGVCDIHVPWGFCTAGGDEHLSGILEPQVPDDVHYAHMAYAPIHNMGLPAGARQLTGAPLEAIPALPASGPREQRQWGRQNSAMGPTQAPAVSEVVGLVDGPSLSSVCDAEAPLPSVQYLPDCVSVLDSNMISSGDEEDKPDEGRAGPVPVAAVQAQPSDVAAASPAHPVVSMLGAATTGKSVDCVGVPDRVGRDLGAPPSLGGPSAVHEEHSRSACVWKGMEADGAAVMAFEPEPSHTLSSAEGGERGFRGSTPHALAPEPAPPFQACVGGRDHWGSETAPGGQAPSTAAESGDGVAACTGAPNPAVAQVDAPALRHSPAENADPQEAPTADAACRIQGSPATLDSPPRGARLTLRGGRPSPDGLAEHRGGDPDGELGPPKRADSGPTLKPGSESPRPRTGHDSPQVGPGGAGSFFGLPAAYLDRLSTADTVKLRKRGSTTNSVPRSVTPAALPPLQSQPRSQSQARASGNANEAGQPPGPNAFRRREVTDLYAACQDVETPAGPLAHPSKWKGQYPDYGQRGRSAGRDRPRSAGGVGRGASQSQTIAAPSAGLQCNTGSTIPLESVGPIVGLPAEPVAALGTSKPGNAPRLLCPAAEGEEMARRAPVASSLGEGAKAAPSAPSVTGGGAVHNPLPAAPVTTTHSREAVGSQAAPGAPHNNRPPSAKPPPVVVKLSKKQLASLPRAMSGSKSAAGADCGLETGRLPPTQRVEKGSLSGLEPEGNSKGLTASASPNKAGGCQSKRECPETSAGRAVARGKEADQGPPQKKLRTTGGVLTNQVSPVKGQGHLGQSVSGVGTLREGLENLRDVGGPPSSPDQKHVVDGRKRLKKEGAGGEPGHGDQKVVAKAKQAAPQQGVLQEVDIFEPGRKAGPKHGGFLATQAKPSAQLSSRPASGPAVVIAAPLLRDTRAALTEPKPAEPGEVDMRDIRVVAAVEKADDPGACSAPTSVGDNTDGGAGVEAATANEVEAPPPPAAPPLCRTFYSPSEIVVPSFEVFERMYLRRSDVLLLSKTLVRELEEVFEKAVLYRWVRRLEMAGPGQPPRHWLRMVMGTHWPKPAEKGKRGMPVLILEDGTRQEVIGLSDAPMTEVWGMQEVAVLWFRLQARGRGLPATRAPLFASQVALDSLVSIIYNKWSQLVRRGKVDGDTKQRVRMLCRMLKKTDKALELMEERCCLPCPLPGFEIEAKELEVILGSKPLPSTWECARTPSPGPDASEEAYYSPDREVRPPSPQGPSFPPAAERSHPPGLTPTPPPQSPLQPSAPGPALNASGDAGGPDASLPAETVLDVLPDSERKPLPMELRAKMKAAWKHFNPQYVPDQTHELAQEAKPDHLQQQQEQQQQQQQQLRQQMSMEAPQLVGVSPVEGLALLQPDGRSPGLPAMQLMPQLQLPSASPASEAKHEMRLGRDSSLEQTHGQRSTSRTAFTPAKRARSGERGRPQGSKAKRRRSLSPRRTPPGRRERRSLSRDRSSPRRARSRSRSTTRGTSPRKRGRPSSPHRQRETGERHDKGADRHRPQRTRRRTASKERARSPKRGDTVARAHGRGRAARHTSPSTARDEGRSEWRKGEGDRGRPRERRRSASPASSMRVASLGGSSTGTSGSSSSSRSSSSSPSCTSRASQGSGARKSTAAVRRHSRSPGRKSPRAAGAWQECNQPFARLGNAVASTSTPALGPDPPLEGAACGGLAAFFPDAVLQPAQQQVKGFKLKPRPLAPNGKLAVHPRGSATVHRESSFLAACSDQTQAVDMRGVQPSAPPIAALLPNATADKDGRPVPHSEAAAAWAQVKEEPGVGRVGPVGSPTREEGEIEPSPAVASSSHAWDRGVDAATEPPMRFPDSAAQGPVPPSPAPTLGTVPRRRVFVKPEGNADGGTPPALPPLPQPNLPQASPPAAASAWPQPLPAAAPSAARYDGNNVPDEPEEGHHDGHPGQPPDWTEANWVRKESLVGRYPVLQCHEVQQFFDRAAVLSEQYQGQLLNMVESKLHDMRDARPIVGQMVDLFLQADAPGFKKLSLQIAMRLIQGYKTMNWDFSAQPLSVDCLTLLAGKPYAKQEAILKALFDFGKRKAMTHQPELAPQCFYWAMGQHG